MPSTSVTLLPSVTQGTPNDNVNYDGSSAAFQTDKTKGDGYYGYTDGLHTVAYFPNNFVGTIKMQGSLATTPSSTDWFDIDGTTMTNSVAGSTAVTYNFTGNFVWVRVAVSGFTEGTIDKVQLNY